LKLWTAVCVLRNRLPNASSLSRLTAAAIDRSCVVRKHRKRALRAMCLRDRELRTTMVEHVKALEAPGRDSALLIRSAGTQVRGRACGLIWNWIFLLAFGSLAALSTAAHAAVPNPTITGPIAATAFPGDPSHDYPFFASDKDLATNGYVEEEFLIQGSANRYTTPSLTTGMVIDSGHPYLTRLIVRRPVDPRRFNGTVLVEWLNVTNGFDADNLWFFD
jgi:hypothetical protein